MVVARSSSGQVLEDDCSATKETLDSSKNLALKGLETMESWMRELGLAMNITACGAKTEDLENYADACPINESGYVTLTRQDVIDVLRASL